MGMSLGSRPAPKMGFDLWTGLGLIRAEMEWHRCLLPAAHICLNHQRYHFATGARVLQLPLNTNCPLSLDMSLDFRPAPKVALDRPRLDLG